MPEKKDRDMWWAFLEGKPEAEWMPVQKSKGKSKHQVSRGLRAWADEPDPQQEHSNPIYELSPNNDEGEVEDVLRMDPADSLPSPAGTPVPLDLLEAAMQPSSSDPTPSHSHTPRCAMYKPREPTTRLLRLIDGVRSYFLYQYPANRRIRTENCLTSINVFHPLDPPLPQGSRTGRLRADRIACSMDFRPVFAN
jgi:hypothetical protein